MGVFLITFAVLLLVVLAMAIGVMNGRGAIKGSCGGLNASGKCRYCEGDTTQCKR
jgi:hypothetical protein